MKLIKLHILIPLICLPMTIKAQTWHIQDEVVFAEKLALGGILAFEIVLKNRQKNHWNKLAELEEKLNNKRGHKNITANTIIVFANKMIVDTQNDINEIKNDLSTKFNNAKLRMGLSRYESEILKEEEYLNEMKDYRLNSVIGLANSGGPGYNINAALKVLIRLTKINNRVNKIYLNVKNSITLNAMKF